MTEGQEPWRGFGIAVIAIIAIGGAIGLGYVLGTSGDGASAPSPSVPAASAPAPSAPAAAPASAPSAPVGDVPSGQFVETFTGDAGFERFDHGIYHRDDVLVAQTQWDGDHDLNCGSPDTQRVVHRDAPEESFYLCKDHLMTSIGDTSGYSTGYFAPKESFTGVRSVSWDVNQTDLGARQWWEVSIVPASFNSGVATCPQCSAWDYLSSTAGLPVLPADGVAIAAGHVVTVNGVRSNLLGWSNWCDVDQEGCWSKAIRRTFTLTDNGNGTITLNAHTQTFTFNGSFPTGPVKVVFKDHNYTPDKEGVPVGHTWHWDNIIIK